MTLNDESKQHLEELLNISLESFDGLCARWDKLKPHKRFNVNNSENFHIGIFLAVLKKISFRGFTLNLEDP